MTSHRLHAGDILLEQLGSENVCFCRTTGATLVLDAISAEIASYLLACDSPKTVDEIALHLGSAAGCSAASILGSAEASVRLLVAEELISAVG